MEDEKRKLEVKDEQPGSHRHNKCAAKSRFVQKFEKSRPKIRKSYEYAKVRKGGQMRLEVPTPTD